MFPGLHESISPWAVHEIALSTATDRHTLRGVDYPRPFHLFALRALKTLVQLKRSRESHVLLKKCFEMPSFLSGTPRPHAASLLSPQIVPVEQSVGNFAVTAVNRSCRSHKHSHTHTNTHKHTRAQASAAAQAHGRTFGVMWDISGASTDTWAEQLNDFAAEVAGADSDTLETQVLQATLRSTQQEVALKIIDASDDDPLAKPDPLGDVHGAGAFDVEHEQV